MVNVRSAVFLSEEIHSGQENVVIMHCFDLR